MACEYCSDEYPIWKDGGYGDKDPTVYIDGNHLVLDYQDIVDRTPISFCLMCGRKLGDTDD